MCKIPLLSVSPFFWYVIMHLSEVRYSSERIFFYQSQVVIELVAHFSWTWFCFFPKDCNPKQIIGYFSYDSQIILAFSYRRSVLSEKVVQYIVQAIFYLPVTNSSTSRTKSLLIKKHCCSLKTVTYFYHQQSNSRI